MDGARDIARASLLRAGAQAYGACQPESDTRNNKSRSSRSSRWALSGRGQRQLAPLALREFALGVEALERFVRQELLRRVHECVFAVLALESEPVDPRL